MDIKYFPFSKGIPWRFHWKNSKNTLMPRIPFNIFYDSIQHKKIISLAFGGFLESFFSLSLLEIVNKYLPQNELSWLGNKEFFNLVKMNGLVKHCNNSFDKKNLIRFPLPLFFDKNDNAYFNVLANYIDNSISGGKTLYPLFRQLKDNCMIKWSDDFVPQLRHTDFLEELNTHFNLIKFKENKPFLLFFDSLNNLTIHKEKSILWNRQQLYSFASMLKQLDIDVIIITNNINQYQGSALKAMPFRFDFAWYMLKKAKFLMSFDIDPLFIGMFISNSIIISNRLNNEYDIEKALKVLRNKNKYYLSDNLSQLEAYGFIKENK